MIAHSCSRSSEISNIKNPKFTELTSTIVLRLFESTLEVHDMRNSSSKLSFIHFADDTTLSFEHDDIDVLLDVLNSELIRLFSINNWLCCNSFSLNFSKTFYMLLSNKIRNVDLDIYLRGSKVEKAEENVVKFLGLRLDNRLRFEEYVRKLCGKVSRACGVLYRVSDCLPKDCLKMLYSSLVLPHLVYCIEVWGGANITAFTRLSKLQDKFLKIMGNGTLKSIYRDNHILPLKYLYEYFILTKFFQNYFNGRNVYFQRLIDELQPQHSYSTRFSDDGRLNVPKSRLSKLHCSFLYKSISFWNCLPLRIRMSSSIFMFKRELKQYLLSRI